MTTRFGAAGAVLALAIGAAGLVGATPASAAGDSVHIDRQPWSFAGVRGKFDRAQLQRGFQVYKEVCSSCHGAKRIAFRHLAEKTGPAFPEDGVKNLAATYQVVDGPNDQGKMFKRPALLSDAIPSPFSNEQEARAANNGASPPDLSMITKARGIEVDRAFWQVPFAMVRDVATGYQEAGADYLYALLTNYSDVPVYMRNDKGKLLPAPKGSEKSKGVERCVTVDAVVGAPDVCNALSDGMNHNIVFPGRQIAMAPPLSDGQVKYADGTPGTVANYARDVAAFSSWAGDPKLEERKKMGLIAMLYLALTSVLLYIAKKRIWAKAH
jgi:ubiquinol-cytochrome c reductase cytochrome c1 subunit